jgi:hypothetical protein
VGKWRLISGKVLKSGEATEGSGSIRFEPDDKEGSRITCYLGNLPENGIKLRVRLDAKVYKSCKFCSFFTAGIDGKRQIIKPGMARYTDNGDWMTIVNDFTITPGMTRFLFHLWLFPGAKDPAFVDNLSIELLK